jgi:hypothetical protein
MYNWNNHFGRNPVYRYRKIHTTRLNQYIYLESKITNMVYYIASLWVYYGLSNNTYYHNTYFAHFVYSVFVVYELMKTLL